MRALTAASLSLAALSAPAEASNEQSTWTCTFDRRGLAITLVHKPPTESGAIVGAAGPRPVTVISGIDAIRFIEATKNGVAQIVSIQIATGEAIHSENVLIAGKLAYLQTQGTCTQP